MACFAAGTKLLATSLSNRTGFSICLPFGCAILVQRFGGKGLKMAKILLVEDDKIIQKIMQTRLKVEGHDVLLANDGIEGIAMAKSEKPDLILMDMLLPQLNGWQATRQIRVETDVPIIALTGAATAEEKESMLEAGCAAVVIKPVNFNELNNKINTLLT